MQFFVLIPTKLIITLLMQNSVKQVGSKCLLKFVMTLNATNFDQYSDCNNFLADKDMDLNFKPSFMHILDIIQPDLPYSRPAVFIQIRQCQHKY